MTDQTDALAQIEELQGQLATAHQQVASLTAERDAAQADTARLQGELAKAGNDLAAANAKLNAEANKDRDFNKTLVAKLREHGIRSEALDAKTGTVDVAKLTADQQVALAKAGVPIEALGL